MAGGSAHRTGCLRMGDRIIAVDGRDMSHASHQEAVRALLSPSRQVVLTVRHDPQPSGLVVSTNFYCRTQPIKKQPPA